jgi:ferredoxin
VSRPRWFVALIKRAFPGRFLVARATRLPLLGTLMDRWLFGGDRLIYLPRDGVVPVHESIAPLEEMALPSQVVDRLIEGASTLWVMDRCLCRDADGCQDYPVDLGCLFLGEAAAGINPALGHPVSHEEALAHVRRCREAGLVHMVGRNKLDTLWLGVGPGQKLLTICNCCPCCCLWRVLPHVSAQIGAKVTAMPGVSVRVGEGCTGCGACARVCFVDAVTVVDGRAVIGDACRGCGRCAEACPQEAIEIAVDGPFLDETTATIAALVDVS